MDDFQKKFELMLPVEALDKRFNLFDLPKSFHVPAKSFLQNIEKILGLKLGIQVPKAFIRSSEKELVYGYQKLEQLKKEGVIQGYWSIPSLPDEPRIFRYYVTTDNDISSNHGGGGAHFFSEALALWPAIGEAVERYALRYYLPRDSECVDASYGDIRDKALNINELAGISPERRRKKNSRFQLFFDEDSRFRWVKGYSLTRKKKAWIPLQLLTFAYHPDAARQEPTLLIPISTGAAAHTNLNAALLRGLLEVIERDAFMITWVNGIAPKKINLPNINDIQINEMVNRFHSYNLELYALSLPTDFPAHVVLSVVIDKSGVGPAVVVGASAGFDLRETILRATTESMTGRLWVRALFKQYKEGNVSVEISDPKMLDREGRLLWWSEQNRIADIQFLLRGQELNFESFPCFPRVKSEKEGLETLLQFCRKKNLGVYYSEILPHELRSKIGFSAVKVIMPKAQPLHLYEGVPYFDGERMSDVPLALGIQINNRYSPNTLPHPFP